MVLPATTAPRQPDPLFMAPGGPGGSTIEAYAAQFAFALGNRPTFNRDIVLWDQRGTRYSKPVLLCPEVSDLPRTATMTTKRRRPRTRRADAG